GMEVRCHNVEVRIGADLPDFPKHGLTVSWTEAGVDDQSSFVAYDDSDIRYAANVPIRNDIDVVGNLDRSVLTNEWSGRGRLLKEKKGTRRKEAVEDLHPVIVAEVCPEFKQGCLPRRHGG